MLFERFRLLCCAMLVAIGVIAVADLAAAPKPKPQTPTQQAAALVADGKAADALPIIDKVLAASPSNRDAIIVKIDALVALDRTPDAAAVYDAFVGGAGKHDPSLARHLAHSELQHMAASTQPEVKELAAELLRKAGEKMPPAASAASSAAASTAKADAPNAPKPKTPEEILASDASPIDARIGALDRLHAPVSDRTRQLVRSALTAKESPVKMAAIDAAVRLNLRELAPDMHAGLQDNFPPVQLKTAAALHQFGDSAGDQRLQETLKGDFLAARLVAARALRATGDKSWIPAIVPLLESPRPHERVLAAELLLDTDKSADAINVLRTSLKADDPPVRAEAAKILAANAQASPWDFLPLMKDANPAVRVQAAGVILRGLPGTTAANSTSPSRSAPSRSAVASRRK